uniref:Uncharacterized protein n=1 Tax=Knipowitschia caucasica TaxID=637954 RepID=A0AAV2J7J9_KNICA
MFRVRRGSDGVESETAVMGGGGGGGVMGHSRRSHRRPLCGSSEKTTSVKVNPPHTPVPRRLSVSSRADRQGAPLARLQTRDWSIVAGQY